MTFSQKITKIRDSFSCTDSFTLPALSDLRKFDFVKTVSDEEIHKDLWPTFLIKECLDILLSSITRL